MPGFQHLTENDEFGKSFFPKNIPCGMDEEGTEEMRKPVTSPQAPE